MDYVMHSNSETDRDSSSARQSWEPRPGEQIEAAVPINSLCESDSPRLAGQSTDHVRLLAESDAEYAPILVHRGTMRVIDGMHRLRAAALRGADEIRVTFFDGSDEDAFVLAVEANIAHGLPLSLADRKAAAARILVSHSHRSDRAIALSAGLSHKTVGAIRWRLTGENLQLDTRVGRDGRVRPLDGAAGRRRASEFMRDNPTATLRQIARASGVSAETARNVRERLSRGEDPFTGGGAQRSAGRQLSEAPGDRGDDGLGIQASIEDLSSIVQRLKSDPSLRFSETGRILIRLLDCHTMNPTQWERLIENVPPHRMDSIVDAAQKCAGTWHEFAEQLKQRRARSGHPHRRKPPSAQL